MPAMEGSIGEKVSRLSSFGQVDIVTGRTLDTVEFVKKWLKLHKVTYDNFVSVSSSGEKAGLNYDVYIDDAPDLAWKVIGTQRYLMLYDHEWNRGIEDNIFVSRIRNLSEAYEKIHQILSHIS